MKLRFKDFKFVSFYYGSMIENGPRFAYEIWYTNPENGKTGKLHEICFTKKAAEKYVRELIKNFKKIAEQKEKAGA